MLGDGFGHDAGLLGLAMGHENLPRLGVIGSRLCEVGAIAASLGCSGSSGRFHRQFALLAMVLAYSSGVVSRVRTFSASS